MSAGTTASVIEIVGPAGSGKTTVAAQMCTRPGVSAWSSVSSADGRARRIVAGGRAMPEVLRLVTRRPPTRQQVAWLGRLVALESVARRPDDGVLVLDQGPLYTLSRLMAARPDCAGDGWITRRTARWANLLDAVVLLDAADEVLVERIRTRPKDHAVKASGDGDALAAVARQRDELELVVRAAEAHGLRVLRRRTDQLPVDQIADDAAMLAARPRPGSAAGRTITTNDTKEWR